MNTQTNLKSLTDIQLVNLFIDRCRDFINPVIFREVRDRGLYNITNYLPKNKNKAQAVAVARMIAAGKYLPDEEMNEIASIIHRLNDLQKELSKMNMADVDKTLVIIDTMQRLSLQLRDYYKEGGISDLKNTIPCK